MFLLASKPEYITKTVTKQKTLYKVNEEGKKVKDKTVRTKEEVQYRIDAAFQPSDISEICLEYIMNYCEANNEGDWLLDVSQKQITDKNDKKRDMPFVNLRAEFVKTFMPSIIKGDAPAVNMKSRIAERFGKK